MNTTMRRLLLSPQGIIRNGLVAEYKFNEGAGQALYDYRNNDNGQLGSTAGADTNDPTWTTQGLLFATDDYCVMPVPFDINGDWTVYLVGKRDGTPSGGESLWSLTVSTASTPYIYCFKTTLNSNFYFQAHNGATTAVCNVGIGEGFKFLVIKKTGSLFTLKSINPAIQSSFSLAGVFSGINKASLGALDRNTTGAFLNGEITCHILYSRATSDAEDERVYRYIKTQLAGRGVTI